jgi:hypothetical protein
LLDSAKPPPAADAAAARRAGRGRVYNSITETIGDTPLVRLNRLPQLKAAKAAVPSCFVDRCGHALDYLGGCSSHPRSQKRTRIWREILQRTT